VENLYGGNNQPFDI